METGLQGKETEIGENGKEKSDEKVKKRWKGV